MTEIRKFWMVIGLGQPGAPNAKQPTRDKAHAEAVRLAGKNPGVEFYVLETVARAISTNVQFDIIQPDYPNCAAQNSDFARGF